MMVSSRRGNKKHLLHEPESRSPDGSEYFSPNKRTVGRRSACAGRFSIVQYVDKDVYYKKNCLEETKYEMHKM